MNTVRHEAAGLLLCSSVHVEGHRFDWATAVFATSAIHQGSTSRLLGPFQLTFPRSRYCHGSKLPATRSYAAHTTIKQRRTRVPARLFESPRHSEATDEGVTPRLLHVRIPSAGEDRRP